jgi:Na+-translocating ferredoxin:NAD+ oxidoreductase RnfC subunit
MLEYRRVPSSRVVNRLRLEGYANRELMRVAETAPRRVELLMTQHAGSPAIPVVKEGDVVHEGDLVGEEPADSLSARVHASIDGRVVFVDDERVILERG